VFSGSVIDLLLRPNPKDTTPLPQVAIAGSQPGSCDDDHTFAFHDREKERAMIATRTKAALAAAKARGVKLGGPKLAQARKMALETIGATADNHSANVLPIIRQIRKAGATTLREIAEALNARGVQTARGGQWYATTVSNVLARG
jgi:hypothetical protein